MFWKKETVNVQDPIDIEVYGWTIESRLLLNDGKWTSWFNYWNHKIYNSKEIALEACSKILKNSKNECRIVPLYRMTNSQYREYKIDRILKEKEKKIFEVRGWKLKEDHEYCKTQNRSFVYKKGSIFIRLEDGSIIKSGTSIDPTNFIGQRTLDGLIEKKLVDEIEIKDEKWIHPHLLKVLKNKLKIN